MPAKVKLIVDNEMGHVLAAFAETEPRQPELTLPDILGTKLPVRNTSKGELQVPENQLELKELPEVSAQSPVTLKQLLEEPRAFRLKPKEVETDKEKLETPSNIVTSIELVNDLTKPTPRTYILATLSSGPTPAENATIAKAFAQAQGEPGAPQLVLKRNVDVVAVAGGIAAEIPLNLLEDKKYDVLVLVKDCAAFVAEGVPVTVKPPTTHP